MSRLFNAFSEWLNWQAPPKSRTDQRRRETHSLMCDRLQRVQLGKAPLEQRDLDYWGDRFTERSIRYWAGCTFLRYLSMPGYWEGIAQARQEATARREGPRRLLVVGPAGAQQRTISHN